MQKLKATLALCAGIWCSTALASMAYAEEAIVKKPLDEVFDQMVIVPYDYQGKAYIHGHKTDVYGDYEMVQRDGRVLVPIRLMGYLATQVDGYDSMWEAIWEPQHPDDVLLRNHKSNKIIKFTVGSTTMLINNEPHSLDVPPQKINGRIMLPLRSAATALDQKIDWLDGLILIGNDYVHLQHPQTTALKQRIASELTDHRKRVEYEEKGFPLAKAGDTVFYFKSEYTTQDVLETLYKKVGAQKEVKVDLPGQPNLSRAKQIEQTLYYVTAVNGQAELHAYDFTSGTDSQLAVIEQWSPRDGWLADVRVFDNELYIVLHYGDLTMGSETLYKVDRKQGALQRVVYSKSFMTFVKDGEQLYFTGFEFMAGKSNNLGRVNVGTGETASVGQPGFAYGIRRTIMEDGSTRHSGNGSLYVQDGFLYTLGYQESDLQDQSAVYRINLSDQSQVRITPPASEFWLEDGQLIYIDSTDYSLNRVNLHGGDQRVLVNRRVLNATLYNGYLYYNASSHDDASVGTLYRYDLKAMQETRLSMHSVASFYAGKAGVYYVSDGYDAGLYRVNANNSQERLVDDLVDTAVLTDSGMVYTLAYEKGIHAVK